MIRPSQVITAELVQQLIDDPSTDETTRLALVSRLESMQQIAAGRDPFAGVVQADYAAEEAF